MADSSNPAPTQLTPDQISRRIRKYQFAYFSKACTNNDNLKLFNPDDVAEFTRLRGSQLKLQGFGAFGSSIASAYLVNKILPFRGFIKGTLVVTTAIASTFIGWNVVGNLTSDLSKKQSNIIRKYPDWEKNPAILELFGSNIKS